MLVHRGIQGALGQRFLQDYRAIAVGVSPSDEIEIDGGTSIVPDQLVCALRHAEDELAFAIGQQIASRHARPRSRSDSVLGGAVQLCLLRHPGFGLRAGEAVPDALLRYLAAQLGVPASAFLQCSRRTQTRLDHHRELVKQLGIRAFTRQDVPRVLDFAAAAAWSTGKGLRSSRLERFRFG
jgi:hypothetical protein